MSNMEEEKNHNREEEQEEEKNDFGEEIVSWEIPEEEKYDKNKNWYIIASLVALLLLAYSLFTANYLFALIIIMMALVIIIREGQGTPILIFSINTDGVILGKNFYDYDEFENFSIVYKPRQEVKKLYIEFKNKFKKRLSIPLQDMNPVEIRHVLQKYLEEDLERTDPPLSEQFAKIFRL